MSNFLLGDFCGQVLAHTYKSRARDETREIELSNRVIRVAKSHEVEARENRWGHVQNQLASQLWNNSIKISFNPKNRGTTS